MIYPDMDPDLRSSFSKIGKTFANLTNDTSLPEFGLKAGSLLDRKQMRILLEIRKRRINSTQWKHFQKD
ncbi:hypothetical protein ACE5IS_09305 [Leptospira wolffii]|uniref:Uncharacterized protein n=1 Tax=Leptospira wolffii TaxID=409998 RepID=A0A2M9ZEE4_9LEPT|nr:hypothetical protein [Leptospira wolffii]EPG64862.1 hypothetical protein LEP1GSC061_2717 [Leptospira wolffii serovar Khorat str. Khorat-H2]PJZ66789.1 hypothetical protein CH371_01415 [Leptospira wolffii]TGK61764.1 hypothetical protein EHQ32_02610 [Leptospira wolffii]TGK70307.1 hypothetical protein EHQ35_18025 [Leptospira wolffii]TGK74948.1 hypothetical protein EHQ27_06205 [Leptospira wolffii]